MAPLVSVIMPCRNAEPMLAPAIRSVLGQTHPSVELIFVDNNSTDASLALARSLVAGSAIPVRFLQCTEPGANNARNLGYTAARGDYIQWLDADDALGLQKLALQVAALEAEPGADFAYCDFMSSRHLPGGRRDDTVIRIGQEDDQVRRTLDGTWYPPHTYLIRRSAADRLQAEQAWLPGTKVGTDVEYSAIAALLGMRFRFVPGARVQYNTWSPTQLSGASTSYALRVKCLETIYQRLGAFSSRPDVMFRVKPDHRILLDQPWSVWAAPQGSISIRRRSLNGYELRHIASGRVIEAQPREATVAATMLALGVTRASAHYAQMIAGREPSLDYDIPFIVATISRFAREGLIEPVELDEAATV